MELLNKKTATVSREEENNDDSEYDRLIGIFFNPDFDEPIRVFQCVVLIDAFVVTTNNIIP